MEEILSVLFLSAIVPVILFQILGVISPFWVCSFDGNQTQSCSPKWLFYACVDGECEVGVFISKVMFGICLVSFFMTFASSVFVFKTSYDQLSSKGLIELDWCKHIWMFTFAQFLAAFSQLILLWVHEVVGWSCIVFASFSYPFAIAFIFDAFYCYSCRRCWTRCRH